MIVLPIGILILLITCIGLGILAAVLIKHGYGKALAIVFGGFALFVGIGIFALVGISPSVRAPSESVMVTVPTKNELNGLNQFVAESETIKSKYESFAHEPHGFSDEMHVNPLATDPDVAIWFLLSIGIAIIMGVLIMKGYGKAMAVVSLVLAGGIFTLFGVNTLSSVQPTSIPATVSAPSAKVQAPMPNEFQDLSHLVATNTTITIGDDEIETKVTKDASDDLLALATKEGQEIEIGSESKSLKEAPEWVTGTTNTNKKVLVSEPYLGSAFLPDGKPNKAVERDLMNQLGEWLAHKYDLTLEKSVSNEGERLCVAGTSHQGLWEKCITETFVLKNETSVGDTETLYVLAEMDNKKAEWFYQLDYARRNQAAQSRTMLIVSGLGGGVFLGLASLYGILSYGGPSKKTEIP